ncbi:short-chain dehydrogenase/reductase SDR [Apiospora saccharicola]|uniref:Short-chain dehydrogenase/reductase SDR n=1 Tax=Apiospora saccharicola TaxID=335842 RepID=A0ABR1UEJ0_9PEZI
MEHSIALVTGSTSGLGHAAALALAREGWHEIIVTGRRLARIQESAVQLAAEAKRKVFTLLELELDKPTSVQSAIAELVKRGFSGPANRPSSTDYGIAPSQPAETQRADCYLRRGTRPGDVPMFSFTDVSAFAAKHHRGDRTAAIEALLRNGPNVKYEANRAYADAKLIIAWWVAALARRLPPNMAAYAVSPGSAPDTKASRNAGLALKWVFIPLVKLIPGMTQTPEIAARRYLQASEFGTDASGQFFASAPKKFTGPLEAMRHPHFHDRVNQEAAWQAVVKVSGVDLSYPAPLSVVS